MTKEEIMQAIEGMTVLELSELVKAMEASIALTSSESSRTVMPSMACMISSLVMICTSINCFLFVKYTSAAAAMRLRTASCKDQAEACSSFCLRIASST